MAVTDGIDDGGCASVGGRECNISAAHVDDYDAVGAGGVGDGQHVAVGTNVVG